MTGIGVSPGIAIGKAYVLEKKKNRLSNQAIGDDDIKSEIERLHIAVRLSKEEIVRLKQEKSERLDRQEVKILDSHIGMLDDCEAIGEMEQRINCKNMPADDAVAQVLYEIKRRFVESDDDYFKARAVDVEDAYGRIVSNLRDGKHEDTYEFSGNTIIISDDLLPSDIISVNRADFAGFATVGGSRISHTAIIANIREIPAVVSCGEDLSGIRNDDKVIVDGFTGKVIVNPDQEVLNEYRDKQAASENRLKEQRKLNCLPAITLDNFRVKLFGNISACDEMEKVFEYGGEGIGLFRTEFMYMGRNRFPSEEEQFEVYRKAATYSEGKPVTIRTLDIGGDKHPGYFDFSHQMNPFLGYRGIRISLDRKDIFKKQLRAILRAGKYGNLRVVFPMISGIEELRRVKSVVDEAKNELERENLRFDKDMKTGVLIEIPAAALTADMLAKEADFFSIGTNDLCQYTLAADRTNEKVAHYYDPFNPAVLRLVKNIIDAANSNGIQVGMCGEMASDPLVVMLLIGMGLDEFSINASLIPHIKEKIRSTSRKKTGEIAETVMKMETAYAIKEYLTGHK